MTLIRLILGAVLAGSILFVACNRTSSDLPSSARTEVSADPKLAAETQAQPITSGAASISCDYDYQSRSDRSLKSSDIEEIRRIVRACGNGSSGIAHFYYKGAIGSDLKPLLRALRLVLSDERVRTRILEIDSMGGDVDAAISAGEEISAGNWAVWVKRNASCYSACVLLLAPATHRSISGSAGIHRMINPKSQAKTPAELQIELDSHVNAVKTYLSKYGVNPALADLMMTVSSREIRVLSQAELVYFGLGETNSVKDDLGRLDLTRRCGEGFVRRWDELRHANNSCIPSRPGGGEGEIKLFDACLQRNYDRLGFPDPKCPNDGPRRK